MLTESVSWLTAGHLLIVSSHGRKRACLCQHLSLAQGLFKDTSLAQGALPNTSHSTPTPPKTITLGVRIPTYGLGRTHSVHDTQRRSLSWPGGGTQQWPSLIAVLKPDNEEGAPRGTEEEGEGLASQSLRPPVQFKIRAAEQASLLGPPVASATGRGAQLPARASTARCLAGPDLAGPSAATTHPTPQSGPGRLWLRKLVWFF